jgi:hypothetical protein
MQHSHPVIVSSNRRSAAFGGVRKADSPVAPQASRFLPNLAQLGQADGIP